MVFKVEDCRQSEWVRNTCQSFLFKHVHKASKKTKWMKLSGLPVGIATGALTLAKRVALIAEALFKGVLNILGCPFSKECHLGMGLTQIIVVAPIQLLIFLPFSLVDACKDLFTKTFYMARDPVQYSHKCWMEYDRNEKARFEGQIDEEQKARAFKYQKAVFNQALSQVEQDPNNRAAITIVAGGYRDGKGVDRDITKAIEFYHNLAMNHDDLEAALWLMKIYSHSSPEVTSDRSKVLQYSEKAASLGSLEAMDVCAQLSWNDGRGEQVSRAIYWYKAAYKQISSSQEKSSIAYNLGIIFISKGHWDTQKAIEWFGRVVGDDAAEGYRAALRGQELSIKTLSARSAYSRCEAKISEMEALKQKLLSR